MVTMVKTYRADSELSTLLELAASGKLTLRIETEDDCYDVNVSGTSAANKRTVSQKQFEGREGVWKDYDVEKVRAALKATQGILVGIDVDELIQRIREDRHDDKWDIAS